MKAIAQDVYGSADVLELRDLDQPIAGEGEVLVRVHAAGVDMGVWHLMAGVPYLIRILGFGFRGPKNPVPGMDVAGVVEAVGPDVTRFQVGDEVFGTCQGSFAEYVATKEEKLVHKPGKLSFEEAAALPVSALTALHGLRDCAKLEAGQKALIIGAGGGVGTYAVQLAKHTGAEVTAVCGPSKQELVRSIGADHALDYTKTEITDSGERYDLIFDIAGNRPLSLLRRALTPRGTLVIVGGEEGDRWLGGTHRQIGALLLSPFVKHNLRSFISEENQADLEVVRELAEAGVLKPVLGKTFPLADAALALAELEAGHATGKSVITVRG